MKKYKWVTAITAAIILSVCVSVFSITAFAYSAGDVNMDGKIDIKDSTLIQKHLAEIDTLDKNQCVLADINNDGEVDITDATMIMSIAAEIIEAPATQPTTKDPDIVDLPFVPAN